MFCFVLFVVATVERTRVKLPLLLGVDGADYINASYIDVS